MKNEYTRSMRYLMKALLGYLAYIAIFPFWLCPLLHKMRGVKIKNIYNTYIGPGVLIDSIYPEMVSIDEEVYVARGTKIIAHYTPTVPVQKLLGVGTIKNEVMIKRGAFVGVSAIILPNVTIGECAVIGSGAVVAKDVPDYAIVVGNPGAVIGDIRESKAPMDAMKGVAHKNG